MCLNKNGSPCYFTAKGKRAPHFLDLTQTLWEVKVKDVMLLNSPTLYKKKNFGFRDLDLENWCQLLFETWDHLLTDKPAPCQNLSLCLSLEVEVTWSREGACRRVQARAGERTRCMHRTTSHKNNKEIKPSWGDGITASTKAWPILTFGMTVLSG